MIFIEKNKMDTRTTRIASLLCFTLFVFILSRCGNRQQKTQIRAAAAAVNIEISDSIREDMLLTLGYPENDEKMPIRVQAIVLSDGRTKVCMAFCDVALLRRKVLDEIGHEVDLKYGIPFENIMLGATHNHSASYINNDAIKKAFIEAIGLANEKLGKSGEMNCYFALGDVTIGQNSRVILNDSTILWVPTIYKFGYNRPTGPYDPQFPVLAFKNKNGKPEAIVFNHSTHNIDAPVNRVLSPGFYGTASQKIEKEFGGTVLFLPGAFGSTHVFDDCPNSERVFRVEQGIKKTYTKTEKRVINRLISVKKEFEYTIRTFIEEEQQKAVSDYCNRWFKESTFWHAGPEAVIQSFKNGRDEISLLQGKTRKTWIQVILLGDIAFVGVPGELFAELGNEIKRLSPFRYTYVVAIANDYIGYIPDYDAFDLGGHQTWANSSISERGTGEAIVNETVKMLNDLYQEKY
jgi:hypothetical protein